MEKAEELKTGSRTSIIDHHLLRSEEGMQWLGESKRSPGGKVLCAAEYMRRHPALLDDRYKGYRQKDVDVGEYHPDNMLPNGEIRENLSGSARS